MVEKRREQDLDSISDSVLEIIAELKPELAGIQKDSNLQASGIDSLAIVNLIVALEARFDVQFSSNRINAKNFSTINCISKSLLMEIFSGTQSD